MAKTPIARKEPERLEGISSLNPFVLLTQSLPKGDAKWLEDQLMKKIHVAGTALAGMLVAAGTFQTKGMQSNPAGQTPAANASATAPAAPSTGSPAAAGAVQPAGQFNFADDQISPVTLKLRPDQTVPTWVKIIYKETPKPTASGGGTEAAGQAQPFLLFCVYDV